MTNPRHTPEAFFRSTRQPYYICAPDYRQNSAGIRCLHVLCHALNENGLEAYVTPASVLNPHLRTPRLTKDIINGHFATGRQPIAVYPEVISGNPLRLPTVARWLLNRPGHLGGDTHFTASELIFCYDPWTVPEGMHAEQLRIPSIDTRIYNNEENEYDKRRSGFCYYAHKYLGFGGKVRPEHVAHGTSLCHDIPRTPEEMAAILRRAEVLYCYEQSAIIQEAMACGCPVIIVTTDYWRKAPWTGRFFGAELDTEGPEGLQRARAEVAHYRDYLANEQQDSWRQFENFVERTQAAAEQRFSLPQSAAGNANLWLTPPRQRFTQLALCDRLYPDSLGVEPVTAPSEIPAWLAPTRLAKPDLELFRQRLPTWQPPPSFHFVILATDASPVRLQATLDSIVGQSYGAVIATVITHAEPPPDIDSGKVHWLRDSTELSQSCLGILRTSPASWCAFIHAGDRIASHGLLRFAEYIHQSPGKSAFYTDEDIVDGGGEHHSPQFKNGYPDWALSGDGLPGLLLARREAWLAVGGWRPLPGGLDELDAAQRLLTSLGEAAVGHLGGIAFHRYAGNAPQLAESPQFAELRRLLVAEHLARSGMRADVQPGLLAHLVRIVHPQPAYPKAAIVIPNLGDPERLARCLDALLEVTDYPDFEVLVIDAGSREAPPLPGIEDNGRGIAVHRLRHDRPFSRAAICNLAADNVASELMVFLDEDIEVIQADWLKQLATQCLQPGVAAVAPRLVDADGNVRNAAQPALHFGLPASADERGTEPAEPGNRVHSPHRVSAIPASCLMVRRAIYLAAGGMDASAFPNRGADIDFCLKIRAAGHAVLWTPYATLRQDKAPGNPGDEWDNQRLLAKWGDALLRDPALNLWRPPTAGCRHGDAALLPDPVSWHPLPNIVAISTAAGTRRIALPVQAAHAAGAIRGRVPAGRPAAALLKPLAVDVVHCAADTDRGYLRTLAAYRELLGCRIVMDIDSLLDKLAVDSDPLPFLVDYASRQAGLVDRYTTGSQLLAAELGRHLADRVHFVPDMVPPRAGTPTPPLAGTRKPRAAWHGAPADLRAIAPAIIALAGEIDWVFIGRIPEDLARHAAEYHPIDDPAEIAELLPSLAIDLGIVPRAATPANRYRGPHPILDYGALGIPVVATAIEAHQTGLPITLLPNDNELWIATIRKFPFGDTSSSGPGKILAAHVERHYRIDLHSEPWAAAWRF